MAGTETAPDTDPHRERRLRYLQRDHTLDRPNGTWSRAEESARKINESGEKTHLGPGGTSPIFIRTPPEWPRDTAECRRRIHTVLGGSCEDAPPPSKDTHISRIRWEPACNVTPGLKGNRIQVGCFINMSQRLSAVIKQRVCCICSEADGWFTHSTPCDHTFPPRQKAVWS